jgi:hypothetical protein
VVVWLLSGYQVDMVIVIVMVVGLNIKSQTMDRIFNSISTTTIRKQ